MAFYDFMIPQEYTSKYLVHEKQTSKEHVRHPRTITARKLLNSPSLQTLITGIKRYTRTNSSINHHFFSPICYFWNFFSHHFSFKNQKTPVPVPAPFSLAKPLFGRRVPLLPRPGSTPPRRCALHRSRGHRSPGSWDGRSTAPWHQRKHRQRIWAFEDASKGKKFPLKNFKPPGNMDLSFFVVAHGLICFCVGFLSRNTRMVLGIEINQKAATKQTHLFSRYFRVKFWNNTRILQTFRMDKPFGFHDYCSEMHSIWWRRLLNPNFLVPDEQSPPG